MTRHPLWFELPSLAFGVDLARAGADALLAWADATGFVDFLRPAERPPDAVPMLCEFDDHAALRRFANELPPDCALPSVYTAASGARHCTALLSAAYLRQVARGRRGTMIRRLSMHLAAVPLRPRPAPVRSPVGAAPAGWRRAAAGRVLIGVIDSGCPFAHRNLLHAGGTRVLSLWDQDEHPDPAGPLAQTPPELGYGAEMPRGALQALIEACTRHGVLDEEACYRRAGRIEPAPAWSHGAAVLDLLAGSVPLPSRLFRGDGRAPTWQASDDAASRADIVFVDLPRDAVQDSSSAGLERWLLDGLRYIVAHAGRHTERIVINVSNGTSRSTLDGGSIIEQAMAALVAEQHARGRSLHIVLPAGNGHDEERHAQVDHLEPGQVVTLRLRVPPGSEATTWVTVRVPEAATSLQLALRAPHDDPSAPPWVGPGQARMRGPSRNARAQAGIVFPATSPRHAGRALVVVGPTAVGCGAAPAPHGDWELCLRTAQVLPQPVHCTVSRNQLNPGALRRALQARFVDRYDDYDPLRWRREALQDPPRPTSSVRRATTLNGLATLPPGQGVVVVGGVRASDGSPSRYSSAGPSAGPGHRPSRRGPDAAAVTDLHPNLPGIVAAGRLSGQAVRVMGTSFAAPQVARHIAEHGEAPTQGDGADAARTGVGVPRP